MAFVATSIGTGGTTAGATATVTVPAGGVPGGCVIVVCVGEVATPTGGSVTDTAGNTYTRRTNNIGASYHGGYFYAWNAAGLSSGDTITYTKKTSGRDTAVSAFYVTGVRNSSSPFDLDQVSLSASTNSPTVTGTPSGDNEFAVGVLVVGGATTEVITQDSINGAWATPPVRANSPGTNMIVFGGVLSLGAAAATTYNPTMVNNFACGISIAFFVARVAVPTSQAILIL